MNEPSPQPAADTAEKRRKQIEKAKAAHLSRQLQTRLQYARLKVDHGWQKQTLNEVENLYFHHYRARIPPRSIHKLEKNAVATSSAPAVSEHPPAPVNPALTALPNSIDQQPASAPDPASISTPAGPDESEPSGMEVDQPPTTDITMAASEPQPGYPASPIVTPPTPNPPQPSPKPSVISTTPPLPAPPPTQQSAIFAPMAPTPTSSFSTFSVSTQPSRNPSYRQPSSSSLQSRGPSPSTRPSPSTMSTSLPGSSNVALTYDSFWSSHSSTSNNYRSALANANAVSFPGLGRGDAGGGLSNFGSGYPFAMGAPTVPFQPLPLPKRPSVSRKRTAPPTAAAGTVRQGLGGGEGGG